MSSSFSSASGNHHSKVLITPQTLAGVAAPYLDVLRSAAFECVFSPQPRQLTEDELQSALDGIVAVIAGSERYSRRVIGANPRLRVVARAGVGYDAVDLAAATDYGVAVTIAPDTNQGSAAEHTFALILGLARDVANQHNAVKAGAWPQRACLPLRGRTLGIVGLGRIGKAVALRGAAFGMRLWAYEPYPDHDFATRLQITLASLEQLLAEADYLSLHLPSTPQTKYLINRQTLARMKPSAFLINTSRGGLVCEADLVEALRTHRIAGAALDVLEQEPPSKNNPLFAMNNVLFTPHAAGVDLQSRDDMAMSAAQAIVSLQQGGWPAEKIVNPEVREKFLEERTSRKH